MSYFDEFPAGDKDAIIADLRANLAAAKADAERYRWLRNANQLATKCVYLTYSGGDLDDAIDAALAGEGKWTAKELADADAEAARLHAAIPLAGEGSNAHSS